MQKTCQGFQDCTYDRTLQSKSESGVCIHDMKWHCAASAAAWTWQSARSSSTAAGACDPSSPEEKAYLEEYGKKLLFQLGLPVDLVMSILEKDEPGRLGRGGQQTFLWRVKVMKGIAKVAHAKTSPYVLQLSAVKTFSNLTTSSSCQKPQDCDPQA